MAAQSAAFMPPFDCNYLKNHNRYLRFEHAADIPFGLNLPLTPGDPPPPNNVSLPSSPLKTELCQTNPDASKSATATNLSCKNFLRVNFQPAASRPWNWSPAHVVYRTAVNIWPSPTGCQLARGTADIHGSKWTARKATSAPSEH